MNAPTPTLRGVWLRTMAKFVTVIIGLGVVAFASTQYQRSVFTTTTADLADNSEVMSALDRSLLDVAPVMLVALYRGGGPDATAQAERDFAAASEDILVAFDGAERTLGSTSELEHLRKARASWSEVDAGVQQAATWTDEEFLTRMASGVDPFVELVWTPYDRADRHVAGVRHAVVRNLEARVDHVSRWQAMIGPAVLMAILVAVAFAYLAARSMSRRVLRPLVEVGEGAHRLRDSNDEEPIDVSGAVREVQDLAQTVNDSAALVRASHGLLHTQAYTDSMTDLPNRKAFTERLREMLDEPGHPAVAVLFIDLDDFKHVNDSLGHAAGDELLRLVGLRISAATRGCDMAARLGGDEFAVAVDLGTDPTAAITVADRILGTLDTSVHVAERELRVGCSIGIAVSDRGAHGDHVDTLLKNADFAMYMAKSQGKQRYELYSSSMHDEMLTMTELRRDLARAVELEQFELHYQPVVDLDSGALLGFEALIRWHHPTRGLLPPGDFIGLAESTGAIVDIGEWVLDEACAALAEHHLDAPELMMSVNVSPRQLGEPDFVNVVVGAAAAHGIPVDCLVLEITEAMAVTSTEAGAAVLTELRSLGFHVALDDFGTGFSSLRYLGDLPVDIIKIDRSFVANHSDERASMLEAMITLGQRLGLHVVAEGIEELCDVERLQRFGSVLGQGFYFARPMVAEEATRFRLAARTPSRTAS